MTRFLLLVGLALSAPAWGQNEETFLEDWKEVETLMERGRWEPARRALLELAEEHGPASYVLRRRFALQNDLRRASFWASHEAPDPRELISGKLLSWRPSSGSVKLEYGPGDLGDFDLVEDEQRNRGPVLLHPLTFEGTFSIEVEIDDYMGTSVPMLMIGYDTEEPVIVVFGKKKEGRGSLLSWMPARIFVGGEEGTLAEDRSTLTTGERTELRVTVKSGSVTAYGNGRKLVSAKRKAGIYGQVALFGMASTLREVRIVGDAQPSWFERLVDDALQEQWKAFDEQGSWAEDLPEWLRPAPPGPERLALALDHPGRGEAALDELFGEVVELALEGEIAKARTRIDHAQTDAVPASFRHFVLAFLARTVDDPEVAAQGFGRVLELEDHRPSRLLRALEWARCGEEGLALAVADLRKLLVRDPSDAQVVETLARCWLIADRLEDARREIDEALERGVEPEALATIALLLTREERGPDWNTVHRHRSDHYEVASNIDSGFCREAARHLESSLNRFNRDLRRLPRDDERYRVFVFSGEEGYLSYLQDVLGARVENTAGIYSPLLRQLVIWNLPDREDLFRTIRHEGFHQYFDRLVDDSPVWLNEGLAEYYENALLVKGEWSQDHLHPAHRGTVKGRLDVDWRAFLEGGRGAFYARGAYSYGLAWLVVHWMLHSDRDNRRRFDRMIDVLSAGGSAEQGLEAAFGGVDWQQLGRQLAQHAASL